MSKLLTLCKQETPYSCMPACLRMVMASFGIFVEEDELRNRAYTTLWGTSIMDAPRCAMQYGFQAHVERGNAQLLQDWLTEGLLPIFVIRLKPYGKHAIVIERFDQDEITFADPVDGQRHADSAQAILGVWQDADGEVLLIHRTERQTSSS